MDFLRDRGFAYVIGAVEFADNIRLNVLDHVFPYQSPCHIRNNADSLEGKVGCRSYPPFQYGKYYCSGSNFRAQTECMFPLTCIA